MPFGAAVRVVPSGAMFISILVLRGRLLHIAAAIVTFVTAGAADVCSGVETGHHRSAL